MGFGGIVEGALDLASGGGKVPASAALFSIEELSGQKRLVELTGRALPYRPFELGVAQRLTTTWNPGYAEATATVLGVMYDPTTVNGMWKDRFIQTPSGESVGGVLGVTQDIRGAVTAVSGSLSGGFGEQSDFKPPIVKNAEAVPSVRDAVALFESITAEGQLIEVTWDAQRRQGFLRRFVPSWFTVHDASWEMHFEWTGLGEEPFLAEEAKSVASVADEIREIVANLSGTIDEIGAITDELDDLVTSQLQAIVALSEDIGEAAKSVNKLINLPTSAAKRTVATLNSVVAYSNDMMESFESEPYAAQHRDAQRADGFGGTSTRSEALTLRQTEIDAGRVPGPDTNVDSTGIQQVSPVNVIGRVDVAYQVKRLARRLAATAALRRSQLLRQIGAEIEETYTAKEGDNLRDVARRVYDDVDEWRRLMLFNELSTSVLIPGQLILIPKLSAEGSCASILP